MKVYGAFFDTAPGGTHEAWYHAVTLQLAETVNELRRIHGGALVHRVEIRAGVPSKDGWKDVPNTFGWRAEIEVGDALNAPAMPAPHPPDWEDEV